MANSAFSWMKRKRSSGLRPIRVSTSDATASSDRGRVTRARVRVTLPRSEEAVASLVETLMGRKPELRFRFIQENAEFATDDLDV